jgi:hypothetical protein
LVFILPASSPGKKTQIHYWCWRTTRDYFDLWLSLEELGVLSCLADNMKSVNSINNSFIVERICLYV